MSADQSPSFTSSQGKRKLQSSSSKSRQSSISDLLRKANDPAPKRQRIEPDRNDMDHHGGFQPSPTFQSMRATTNFQPHMGAKTLVIKNLRKTPRTDVDTYYTKTWIQLDACLTNIFAGKQPQQSLEQLYKGVEDTCRQGRAEKLYKQLSERCEIHLHQVVLPSISAVASASDVEVLRNVFNAWQTWSSQLLLLRSIFFYLDRSFLLNSKDYPQLNDMGISQFRRMIFVSKIDTSSLGPRVLAGICDLVNLDRINQEDLFDGPLLKNSVRMLHIFGVYGKSFEPRLVSVSAVYFARFAEERCELDLKDYISACDRLLSREETRCDAYNFDSSTKKSLLKEAQKALIDGHQDVLLDTHAVAKLLDLNVVGSLKSLYELLKLSDLQQLLRAPWDAYIKKAGSAIVSDKERGDEMVIRLLELKKTLDIVVRDAFSKDQKFISSLRESFGSFINDRKNITASWGTGNSKVGEMIAKYIDALLRGGLKAVPRSLASDATDRQDAESKGQASTGDEDAELDRQLEQGLELFRFIEGKDVFEAFYKKDLARRLLMARSASQDAERNMLTKLKSECGASFTHNLEQMFKDQELARDEMISYKQSLSNTSKTTMDLQVSVLSAAAWPTYPDVAVNLPDEVARHIEKYDRHYKHKHTGRRLTWKHALAHSIVKAQFKKGPKELVVSGFQAIVLVLFNEVPDDGSLSYTAIADATGLVDAELTRTLQSLACAKIRPLIKNPKGRDVNPTDTFKVNHAFTDPKYRIKINQVQLKETKEENKETHERVAQDRQYETQAAIVRIMKARKEMAHSALVAEVINQTKSRGSVEVGEIKSNIEKLIEKDYIEREGSSYVYLA